MAAWDRDSQRRLEFITSSPYVGFLKIKQNANNILPISCSKVVKYFESPVKSYECINILSSLMKFINKHCRLDGREGRRESRYKLPGPGRPEGDPGLIMLHIVVRLFVDCTK